MSLRKQLDIENIARDKFSQTQFYRRLFLSRYIFCNLFPEKEKELADKHFNNLARIAKSRDVPASELIVDIIETSNCPEDIFFEKHLDILQTTAYYIAYGNVDLELEHTTENQRRKATVITNNFMKGFLEENEKNEMHS